MFLGFFLGKNDKLYFGNIIYIYYKNLISIKKINFRYSN